MLLKCFSLLFNLLSQIFHFFHIFNFWWNNHWNISSDFQLWYSDSIRSVQNGLKWIKLDQIRFLMKHSLKYIIRFSIFNFFLSDWIRSVQNGSNLIKLDHIWFCDEIINEIYHPIFNFIYFLIRLNQICQNESEWIKRDRKGSNLIKLYFWWNNNWNISSDFQLYCLIRFNQICQNESEWIKTDQTW